MNCPLSIGFPRTCATPFKVGRKNSGSGYNPPASSLGLLAFLKLRISCTFPLSSSLYGTFAALSGFIAEISFSCPGIADLVAMWKRLVAGCENCWRLGRKPGDTSSDEPQTSIITWKMTQSTWSIAAEKMGTPVSSSNYQAL